MQYAGVEASISDGIEENRESLFRTENLKQANRYDIRSKNKSPIS